ncbi:MAG: hypothetical protein V9E96_18990 [Chitinophagaceae bacterium]|nr:hypothetical protein [Chitinophagaceae bacterium]
MKKIIIILVVLFLATNTQAQFWKKKDESKTDTTTTEKKKSGGGFFQKVIAKVAKGAAKVAGSAGTTKSTDNFESFEPAIFLSSNLYPKSVGTMQTDFFNGWKEGGDLVGLMLMPKDKLFFYKLDGAVKINGKTADYQSTGVYTTILDGNADSKTLELQTKQGKTAKFILKPKENKLKILSINNQTSNATIDMSKDFTIQLDGFSPNALIKVEVVMQTIGIRAQIEAGSYRAAKSVTIPGYIFKHLNVRKEQKLFKYNDPYILVSETEVKETKDENGNFKDPIKYYAGSSSYFPFKIANAVENTHGIELQEGNCSIEKGNAFFSQPIAYATTVAPIEVVVKGTTYYYDSKESKVLDRKTITTKEVKFPQIPDAKLEQVSTDLYNQITGILKDELGVNIISPEKVTATPAYQKIDQYTNNDENTEYHFTKAYMGLKELPDVSPLAIMAFGTSTLFQPLNANALLKVNLDMQISWNGSKPLVTPILQIELLGTPNGGITGAVQPTKFFTAEISGESIELKKGIVTDEIINNILQVNNLTNSFKQGFKKLVSKEKENNEYISIWNLQK